jgi:cobalt-zinc-cadmium efflux system protein
MNILMEGTPKEVDIKKLKAKLMNIKHVQDIKDLHTWTLAGGKNVMTCHIELVQ